MVKMMLVGGWHPRCDRRRPMKVFSKVLFGVFSVLGTFHADAQSSREKIDLPSTSPEFIKIGSLFFQELEKRHRREDLKKYLEDELSKILEVKQASCSLEKSGLFFFISQNKLSCRLMYQEHVLKLEASYQVRLFGLVPPERYLEVITPLGTLGDKVVYRQWYDYEGLAENIERWSYDRLGRPVVVTAGSKIFEINPSYQRVEEAQADAEKWPLVAVFDTGVDYNHPRLAKHFIRVDYDKNPELVQKIFSNDRRFKKLRLDKAVLENSRDRLIAERHVFLGFSLMSGTDEKTIEQHDDDIMARIHDIRTLMQDLVDNSRRENPHGLVLGWDFDDNDERPYDFGYVRSVNRAMYDHGSHVSGIIVGEGDDPIGIIPIRHSFKEDADLYWGLKFAIEQGAHVVNMSFGTDRQENMRGIKRAIEEYPNVLFVAAAGNDGNNNDLRGMYPASFVAPNLLAVAAVDKTGGLASWSNYGVKTVLLSAPGEDIDSSVPGGGIEKKSGTSMATPAVARVAALLLGDIMREKNLTNKDITPAHIAMVVKTIRETVDVSVRFQGKVVTSGQINEAKARELLANLLR